MAKKKIAVFGVLSAALLFGATYNVFGQKNAVEELGNGQYIVSSTNTISTTPSFEEKRIASQKRTELIESGATIDQSASLNLKPDSYYPDQRLITLNEGTGKAKALNNEATIVQYKIKNTDGVDSIRNLYIHKVITDNGLELVPDITTSTPFLVPSPSGDKYLFSDNDSIFTIDTKLLSVKQITQDSLNGISKSRIQQELKDNEDLFWATNPIWSLDGTQVSYLSNRSMVGKSGMEIWVVDISKGIERKVHSSDQPIGTFGWKDSDSLIIWEYSTDRSNYIIKEFSLTGGPGQELIQNVDILDITNVGNKILYSIDRPNKEIWLLDMVTKEKKKVITAEKGIQFDPTARFSPEGEKIVALEYTGLSGERAVHVTNIKTGTTQTFVSPANTIYSATPEWVNNDTLLLNGIQDGKSKAWTISVNDRGETNE